MGGAAGIRRWKIVELKLYQMLSRSPGMTKRERDGAECILQKWRIISSKIGHTGLSLGGLAA